MDLCKWRIYFKVGDCPSLIRAFFSGGGGGDDTVRIVEIRFFQQQVHFFRKCSLQRGFIRLLLHCITGNAIFTQCVLQVSLGILNFRHVLLCYISVWNHN